MVEISTSDLISLTGTMGVIGTLFVIFYFSRRGLKSVLVDIETKVLNDLDEKMAGAAHMLVNDPQLVKVLDKNQTTISSEVVFAYYILYMCAHAFHMHQRKILNDNEWAGWLRWMRSAFGGGTIGEHWVKRIRPENWFDPAFEDFINSEIIKQGKV